MGLLNNGPIDRAVQFYSRRSEAAEGGNTYAIGSGYNLTSERKTSRHR